MKKLLLAACCAIGLILAVVSAYRLFSECYSRGKAPVIPTEGEISEVTAMVDDREAEMGIPPVPTFAIPTEMLPGLLDAFKPVELLPASKKSWDSGKAFPRLASINIETKNSHVITINVYDVGKNRVGFTVNGVSCIRGGVYKPISEADDHQSYADESELITMMIHELYTMQKRHRDSENLRRYIEDLKRSRGE